MGIRISKDHLHPSVIESITSLIGDLDQLETTAKGNAVEAINELLANGGNKEELEALIAELKSILEDEGVDITEEDDMASLISKVDEEFDDMNSLLTEKDNSISDLEAENNELETSVTDTKNRLYELMSEGGYDVESSMSIDDMLGLLELSGISVTDIKQIVTSGWYAFILKTDGSIYSCGDNSWGQLGLGNRTDRTTFTQVTTNINNDVKQIACGTYDNDDDHMSFSVILKNDGSVWSCGYNNGQLGLGDTTDRTSFTQVTTNVNNDVKQIACGQNHTIILKNDGSLWGCGHNDYGQLGLGTDASTSNKIFAQVTTNINNDVSQIACGNNYTFIIKNDGSVWSCGINSSGQLGLNSTTDQYTFTQVTTNISDVKQIACGYNHTFILKNDGSVYSCGNNGYGRLGLGNTTTYKTFTQVTTNINNDVKQIACGYNYTFILKNDGSVWSCGYNNIGQLGLGTSDYNAHSTFTQVTTNINNDVTQIACSNMESIYDEYVCTFILKNDGSVWSCGANIPGVLGLGTSGSDAGVTTFTNVPRGL